MIAAGAPREWVEAYLEERLEWGFCGWYGEHEFHTVWKGRRNAPYRCHGFPAPTP